MRWAMVPSAPTPEDGDGEPREARERGRAVAPGRQPRRRRHPLPTVDSLSAEIIGPPPWRAPTSRPRSSRTVERLSDASVAWSATGWTGPAATGEEPPPGAPAGRRCRPEGRSGLAEAGAARAVGAPHPEPGARASGPRPGRTSPTSAVSGTGGTVGSVEPQNCPRWKTTAVSSGARAANSSSREQLTASGRREPDHPRAGPRRAPRRRRCPTPTTRRRAAAASCGAARPAAAPPSSPMSRISITPSRSSLAGCPGPSRYPMSQAWSSSSEAPRPGVSTPPSLRAVTTTRRLRRDAPVVEAAPSHPSGVARPGGPLHSRGLGRAVPGRVPPTPPPAP